MQTNQNVPRPFPILLQAITYLTGGMFLLTVSTSLEGRIALTAQILGPIFIGVAILLGISACVGRFVAWANRVDRWFFLGLFYVSLANVIFVAVVSSKYRAFFVVLVLAFLCIVIAALLLNMSRMGARLRAVWAWLLRRGARLRTILGSRAVWAWLLRRVSIALSLFALAMVIAQVNVMGGPILYLAIGLACLGVASLL